MGTIKATLRTTKGIPRTNQQGLTTVYILYTHKGRNLYLNTEVKIPPEYWRGEKDQIKPIGGELKGREGRNLRVGDARRKVEGIVNELLTEKVEPTIERVKQRYSLANTDPEEPEEINLYTLWEEYYNDSAVTKADNTLKAIKHAKMVFTRYWSRKRSEPTLETLNLDFYHAYRKHLLQDLKLNNNSAGKEIKNLKAFLNYLKDRGYPVSSDVGRFKVLKEKMPIVFLTEDELQQLYEHHFKNERLTRVRDLFLVQAYTGLRWSDLSRLGPQHIHNDIIEMTAYKNKRTTLVPMAPIVREILARYDNQLPQMTPQELNRMIKICCRLAGITQVIEKPVFSGGKKSYRMLPKYAEISSHTAVKSFISNCAAKGISPAIIAEITGKSLATVQDHYLGVSRESIIRQMSKAFG
ncbi:MAG: phage integrase SAM-like domain-containing protein [Bacteroidota bacterium]